MVNYGAEQGLLYSPATSRRASCILPWNKKYRSYLEIIASLLDAARENAQDRYCLMKQTGANYAQLKKYLQPLLKMDFIEASVIERRVFYRVTRKGLAFLAQYYILLGILLDAQQPNKEDSLNVRTCSKIASPPRNPSMQLQNSMRGEESLVLTK